MFSRHFTIAINNGQSDSENNRGINNQARNHVKSLPLLQSAYCYASVMYVGRVGGISRGSGVVGLGIGEGGGLRLLGYWEKITHFYI